MSISADLNAELDTVLVGFKGRINNGATRDEICAHVEYVIKRFISDGKIPHGLSSRVAVRYGASNPNAVTVVFSTDLLNWLLSSGRARA